MVRGTLQLGSQVGRTAPREHWPNRPDVAESPSRVHPPKAARDTMHNSDNKRISLRERIANMTPAEFRAAGEATRIADEERERAGLLEVIDDREEALLIGKERLPVLLQLAGDL